MVIPVIILMKTMEILRSISKILNLFYQKFLLKSI